MESKTTFPVLRFHKRNKELISNEVVAKCKDTSISLRCFDINGEEVPNWRTLIVHTEEAKKTSEKIIKKLAKENKIDNE